MTRRAFRWLVIGAGATTLFIAPVLAQTQKIEGIVVTNKDGQLVVKTPAGDQTISLPADARIRSISGPLGGQKEVMPQTSLLPGLPVTPVRPRHPCLEVSGQATRWCRRPWWDRAYER